ncbi:MAG: arginine--tRNA ligase [Acidobacteriota bacterium]
MVQWKKILRKSIYELLKGNYELKEENIKFDFTPGPEHGDLALTISFELSKSMKKSPIKIADEISSILKGRLKYVEDVKVENGYINLFLKRNEIFNEELFGTDKMEKIPREKKIIVEHTNINPNKAAHIGHLRNACLGDALVKSLKYMGENVEVQNYIDDTGIQVADVVFGFQEIKKKNLGDLDKIEGKIDYYFWDLYQEVSAVLESSQEFSKRREDVHKKIENASAPEWSLSKEIVRRIVIEHLKTMARIGVHYDLLPFESQVLKRKFWEKAFQLMKEKGVIYLSEKGKNKGCWVIYYEGWDEKEKVIVRSSGTVTYVGKDIAYQLWKFGLLGEDFNYSKFDSPSENHIQTWITSEKQAGNFCPSFGKASKVYNVIDVRQADLQKVLVQSLRALGFEKEADKSIHFSYEMVVLSRKAAKELGFSVSEQKKGFVEVSGRKGIGMKADDLLDKLEEKAMEEIDKRNSDLDPGKRKKIAKEIAQAGLRYFMLKFGRNSVLVFDFDEALNFEGETGPYLQYSFVRIQSILNKLKEAGIGEEEINSFYKDKINLSILNNDEKEILWQIILEGSYFLEALNYSVESLEFSFFCKYIFNLAQKFNNYYHKYSIIHEKDPEIRKIRILILLYIREKFKDAFEILGIPVPEKM